MKMNRRFGAVAGAISIVAAGGLLTSSTVGAVAPPPTAVGNHHVTCDTFVGAGKFTLPLDLLAPNSPNPGDNPPSPTTLTLKGVIDGCVDTDDAAVLLAPSKITVVVTYSDNFATTLATPQTVTATGTIGWKFDKPSVKTDLKTTVFTYTAQPAPTQAVTIPGLSGAYSISNVPAGNIAIAAGNAFTGGDGGALTTMSQLLGQTTAALAGQLFDGNKGIIKGISIGAGEITVG